MKQKILTIFHRLHFKKVSYEKQPLYRPAQDWRRILFALALSVVAVGALHWYLYQLIEAGEIFTKDSGDEPLSMTLNRESIQKVVQEFDLRSGQLNTLQIQKTEWPDPSI